MVPPTCSSGKLLNRAIAAEYCQRCAPLTKTKQKIGWGGELTFAVHLAAVLNDTRLAVLVRPGSRRLAVERVVAREVLLRVHGRRIAIADRHVLHEHGKVVV